MPGGKKDTIYALLKWQGERASESVAIQAPDRQALTYGGLFRQVHNVVRVLSESGVRRSDRVAIVLPNGPEMAVAFLGVAACASAAPLNPAYSPSEFEFYFSDLKPKALVLQSGTNSAVTAIAEKRGIAVIELSPDPEAAGVFTLKLNHRPVSSGFCFPRPEEVALVLHTSGTTSRPKMVPLSHANLLASADNIATTLGLSEADRCLNVMPLFHIHGLVGALLSSVMAGAGVICVSGFDPDRFFTWLVESHPSWYTAVPTIHHAVLARAQADVTAVRNHSLRFIRSSSSALSPRLMQELEELFEVPVIESYGMTEAAHQMASNPLPPGLRKTGSVGLASGPEVSIMGEDGNLLSTGETGEIVIRGANVMHGYEGDSEANHKAFTNGWFRTGDQGHLDGDGYLFLTGRLKEIINRGGEKISAREIDDALLEHPDIVQAAAFAIPHPALGETVAAAVVLRENSQVTEANLRERLTERLADFKIPARILIVGDISKTSTGKVRRADLAATFAEPLKSEFVAPKNDLEALVAGIYADVLGSSQVGSGDNFFALGGDSLRATQVISRVRSLFSVNLSIVTVFRKPTVAELSKEIVASAKAVDEASKGAMGALLKEISDGDSRRASIANSGQAGLKKSGHA